jgi:NAD(P)-dependent dehydrogenase (short-subunit alcohol dehydrogenase family)
MVRILARMKPLTGKIAIVAGASRGAGRGIALALGSAGATVYVAARTSKTKPAKFPGSIEETADEVTARGGVGIPFQADLGAEPQTAALFERVNKDHDRLDILASAVWYDNVAEDWSKKFWNTRPELWHSTMQTMTAHFLLGVHAARLMAPRKAGLIAFVTDNVPDLNSYHGQMMWDVGHHAINRLILGMSHELASSKVTVVGANPGFMRTERVIHHMRESGEKAQRAYRFDLSETPEYIGRGVSALAADPEVHRKSGELLWGGDLAKEYGFTDTDGRYIPRFDPKAPRQEIPAEWLQSR